jgi:AcrR family transcriptional regulator
MDGVKTSAVPEEETSRTVSGPAEPSAAPKRRRAYLPAHERRRRIILAAQEVFARSSLQGARTRDLARAAEINQATLFEHFESKEDLFIAAVVQPLLDLMRGARDRAKAYEAAASPGDMLALAQVISQRHLETTVEIYPLLVAALFSDPQLGKKLYCEQIAPLIRERSAAMQHLVKDGMDPDLVNLAIFGIFFAVAMDRAFTGKTENLTDVARQVTDLVAFGFARDRQKD